MATVHTNLFSKVPMPCLSCKNSIEMPCEGCEHEEDKIKAIEKHKKLIDMTIKAPMPGKRDLGHRIIGAIMEKKHELEEEHDKLYGRPDYRALGAKVQGLEMALELAREVMDGDAHGHD